MARRPSRPNAIPRLRRRERGKKIWYYYDHGGRPRREEPLGCDYGRAIQRWAELERPPQPTVAHLIAFRHVADRYRAEVIPRKAAGTQRGNTRQLVNLIAFFDDPPAPLDAIKPVHVAQYMRWRRNAPVSANREKALLSHIWNFAREQGYTTLPNPCGGIHRNTEKRRVVYVEDGLYAAVWNAADVSLRDALDLAYLTGQRPADVYRMTERDIRDGFLHIRQGKTGAKIRMVIEGALADLLDRIRGRKQAYTLRFPDLIVDEKGRPLGKDALRYRFDRARATAGVPKAQYQFRDLRAKAGSDKDAATDSRQAQRQLGHRHITTTEIYIRDRLGDAVTPTK